MVGRESLTLWGGHFAAIMPTVIAPCNIYYGMFWLWILKSLSNQALLALWPTSYGGCRTSISPNFDHKIDHHGFCRPYLMLKLITHTKFIINSRIWLFQSPL
jgi:hypothetical protein